MQTRIALYAFLMLSSLMVAPSDVSPVEPAEALCYLDPENPVGSVTCVVVPTANCAIRYVKGIMTGQHGPCPMP